MIRGLKVIIAGGGVGGLTLAGMLTQRGADVIILERAHEMRQGFGLTMWPNAFLAMEKVGGDKMYDALVRPNQRIDRLRYKLGNGRTVADIDIIGTLVKEYGENGYACTRIELLESLATVAGVDVYYNAHVVSAAPDGTVTLASGETVKGDIVVGADGVGSAVRKSLLPPGYQQPKSYELRGWQGVVEGMYCPSENEAEVFFGPTGSSGMFPLPDNRTYWFFLDPARDRPRLEGWNPAIREMIEATEPEYMHADAARDRPADPHWGTGRVTLLGDAAHPFLPTAGQGACIAIEDAAVLTNRLEKFDDPVAAMRQFEEDRFLRVRKVCKVSRRLFLMQKKMPRFARDIGLYLTPTGQITKGYGEPTFPIPEFLNA